MNFEKGYKRIRNLLFVCWLLRTVDYVIKEIPFLQPWLEQIETSPVGVYATSIIGPLLENSKFQEVWGKIYEFLGMPAFICLVGLAVLKVVVGKIREADLFLQIYKTYIGTKLTIECSAVPRMRVGKCRYIRVIDKKEKTDKIIPIEAEKENQYEEVLFYKRKGKVHMQKPDGHKVYLEKDIWKKCEVEDSELWIKLV